MHVQIFLAIVGGILFLAALPLGYEYLTYTVFGAPRDDGYEERLAMVRNAKSLDDLKIDLDEL